jgi:hypothetical protein
MNVLSNIIIVTRAFSAFQSVKIFDLGTLKNLASNIWTFFKVQKMNLGEIWKIMRNSHSVLTLSTRQPWLFKCFEENWLLNIKCYIARNEPIETYELSQLQFSISGLELSAVASFDGNARWRRLIVTGLHPCIPHLKHAIKLGFNEQLETSRFCSLTGDRCNRIY